MSLLRVLRYAALVGWQDFRTQWTWASWFGGYMTRIAFQLIFYAAIGVLLQSRFRFNYLVVGNAVMTGPVIIMLAVQGTATERWLGTLPLLVAAPASPLPVLAGRSLEWLIHGVSTAVLALLAIVALFGIAVDPGRLAAAVVVVLLVCAASYAFALFLGGLALRMPRARNLLSTVASLGLMTLSGVNVPTSFFPAPLQAIAMILPLTHGLQAIRGLLADASVVEIARECSLEALVCAGWLVAALLSFDRLIAGTRASGNIDLD